MSGNAINSTIIKSGEAINIENLEAGAYIVTFKNGKAHGKGRLIHSDGDVYFGDWL